MCVIYLKNHSELFSLSTVSLPNRIELSRVGVMKHNLQRRLWNKIRNVNWMKRRVLRLSLYKPRRHLITKTEINSSFQRQTVTLGPKINIIRPPLQNALTNQNCTSHLVLKLRCLPHKKLIVSSYHERSIKK